MASKLVAIPNMVSAIIGTGMYGAAATGLWTAGSITTTSANHLSVDGTKVIIEAECTFTFAGLQIDGTTPVNGSSDVTLSPSSTKLTDSGNDLLVFGDTTSDSYGNTLVIIAGQIKLKTS